MRQTDFLSWDDGHLIFIYGTLRKGGRAHGMMRDAEFKAVGSINGRLVHVDQYPGLILCDDRRVLGEVYLVNDDLLADLDRYEGCLESPAHYLREETLVSLENGETILAQVYIFQLLEPHHEDIDGGDWIRWMKERN